MDSESTEEQGWLGIFIQDLSPELIEAYQVCWDVWTDGRLRAERLPGVSLAERRREFFRRFAGGGLLLPRHWKTFHDLWDGQLPGHRGLLEATRRLPRLGSARPGDEASGQSNAS